MAFHRIPNYFHLANYLNQNYQMNLSINDYIFHALLAKAKMVLEVDRNACVKTTLSAYWVFSYIDIAWLRSDDKFSYIPDIFALPPNYAGFF